MQQQTSEAPPNVMAGSDINQYLTFTLEQDDYGLEILRVQEIKGHSGITPIPNTPPHVKGVMNLRGTVIPVVDLRIKFGMSCKEYDKFTVIIVVTVRDKIVGLVVDAVSDVLDIPSAQVRPAPELGARADTRFIAGMATIAERLVVLLDIERLLSDEDVPVVSGGR
jgi:purine-binding chemotaxis protein CheW